MKYHGQNRINFIMHTIPCTLPGIIIGFKPTDYEVRENGDTVTLTVRVLNGDISEERSILVRVTTAQGKCNTFKLVSREQD